MDYASGDGSRARQRWRRLALVLREHSLISDSAAVPSQVVALSDSFANSHATTTRFETFQLIRWRPIDESGVSRNYRDAEDERAWWLATLDKPRAAIAESGERLALFVRFASPSVSAAALGGFDNTGNVRVWASEETMAFWSVWSLTHRLADSLTSADAVVCELAGGMTCLAGLFLAASLSTVLKNKPRPPTTKARIILTDGNEKCVQNVRSMIERNRALLYTTDERVGVETRVLKFEESTSDLRGRVDYVLAADCLFVRDSHEPLLDTLAALLKRGGRAYIVAPERHGSLRRFASLAACSALWRYSCHLVELRNAPLFKEILDDGGHDASANFPNLLMLEKL